MPVWKPAQRESIAPLLDLSAPLDASASHYGLSFPAERVELLVHRRPGQAAIDGFLARVRTAQDRTQPEMIVLRAKAEASALALLRAGVPAGRRVYLRVPLELKDLVQQMLAMVDAEDHLMLMHRDPAPLRSLGPPPGGVRLVVGEANNGSPLYQFFDGETPAAYAGVNWIDGHFAEVRTETAATHRGRGLATHLVAGITEHLLATGRTPLYFVAETNFPSRRVAAKLGYAETGEREVMGHAVLPLAVPAGLAGLVRY